MKRLLVILLILLSLLAAGCFRDAGEDRQSADSAEVQIFPTLTNTAAAALGTAEVTAEVPPLATEEAAPPSSPTPSPGSQDNQPLPTEDPAPPTGGPPTVAGNTFGDPGIDMATLPPTQPPPEALITPTAFADGLPECIHAVQANETLIRIAELYAVEFQATVDSFIAANPAIAANPGALFIGQELIIPNCNPEDGSPLTAPGPNPNPTEAIPDNSAPTPGSGESTYTVQAGDTLFAIARRFNLSTDALIAANPALAANPNSLQIGQVLVIPASGQ